MSEDEKEPSEEKPKVDGAIISLRVTNEHTEVLFKIKKTTPLKWLMMAFCKRQDQNYNDLIFNFESQRINENDTPEKWEKENQDMIEVYNQRIGGATSRGRHALKSFH